MVSRPRAHVLHATAFLVTGICSAAIADRPPAPTTAHVNGETVPAKPEDVPSVDAIMNAFYDVVNVEPNGRRQWSRDRTLYVPGIRFTGIDQGKVAVYDHQKLVDETEPMVQKGFYEKEVKRTVRTCGDIAHVFSTYETRRQKAGPVTARGVNSVELYRGGKRWWISAVSWYSETPGRPLPAEFVPEAPGTK